MKKRLILAVILCVMLMFSTGMSAVAIASEMSIEDIGKAFDQMGEQFKNFDINNLPTGENTNVNTNDNTEIKTDMMIAASNTYTLGLQNNGRVVSSGLNLSGADSVSDWRAITMIAAGFDHSVGLKSDGTVVASGSNADGQCNVSEWEDIIAVAAGRADTIGLKKDGTVVGCGSNSYGELDFSAWNNIIAIAAGSTHSVGLKCDGTVLAIGKDCGTILNTSAWKDIVSISASSNDIMGLDKNGRVFSTFANKVSSFKNVVAIATAEFYAVGLKKDGTVVTNSDDVDVSGWKNIIAIAAGTTHLVGLRSDGTVVATEMDDEGAWKMGQTKVGGWQLNVYKAKPLTALPTASKVLVNGLEKAFDAYTIESNNYFKLRDLAFVLNGTGKQFEVTWDSSKNAINMLSKKPYTPAGSEMTRGNGKANSATASTAKIYIDGQEKSLKAYTMNGNNYFKLRDVMQVFDVYVGWDGAKNTITVDTSKGY